MSVLCSLLHWNYFYIQSLFLFSVGTNHGAHVHTIRCTFASPTVTIKEDYDDDVFLGQIMFVMFVLMKTDAAIMQVFLFGRLFSVALFIRLIVPFSLWMWNRSTRSSAFWNRPPDWYLLLTTLFHYRKHYSILCISAWVILREPFIPPLLKILNKFNCLHPPSEMTWCALLHN